MCFGLPIAFFRLVWSFWAMRTGRGKRFKLESLILAQIERWRHA